MRFTALVIVIATILGSTVAAVERMPLPAVALMNPDGTPVQAAGLARQGTWVIFYVHAGCQSCEAVLSVIDRLDVADAGERIAVVVETRDASTLSTLAARVHRSAGVRWLADPAGAMGAQVAPQAAATVLGVRGTIIEWSLAGIMTDTAQAQSVVTAWLSR